jgi:hypothetical protein
MGSGSLAGLLTSFPRSVREALLADGLASEHRWVPNSGWVTFHVYSAEDLSHALRRPGVFALEAQKSDTCTPVLTRDVSPFVRNSTRIGRVRRTVWTSQCY